VDGGGDWIAGREVQVPLKIRSQWPKAQGVGACCGGNCADCVIETMVSRLYQGSACFSSGRAGCFEDWRACGVLGVSVQTSPGICAA